MFKPRKIIPSSSALVFSSAPIFSSSSSSSSSLRKCLYFQNFQRLSQSKEITYLTNRCDQNDIKSYQKKRSFYFDYAQRYSLNQDSKVQDVHEVKEEEFMLDLKFAEAKVRIVENVYEYQGEWSNGKREGWGILKKKKKKEEEESLGEKNSSNVKDKQKNGSVLERYEGMWKEDKRHGYGVLTFADGEMQIEASWNNGELDTEYGIIVRWKMDDIINESKDGTPSNANKRRFLSFFGMVLPPEQKTRKEVTAFGILQSGKNIIYEGEINVNVPHGFGRLRYPSSIEKEREKSPDEQVHFDHYVGEISSGQKNGYGVFNYHDQRKLMGDFLNGSPNGKAMKLDSKGHIMYLGEMRYGAHDGYGLARFDESKAYEGNWKDNNQNGFGVFEQITKTEDEDPRFIAETFIGAFEDNFIHGLCSFQKRSQSGILEYETVSQWKKNTQVGSVYEYIRSDTENNDDKTSDEKSEKITVSMIDMERKPQCGVIKTSIFDYFGQIENYLPHGYGMQNVKFPEQELKGIWKAGNFHQRISKNNKMYDEMEAIIESCYTIEQETTSMKQELETIISDNMETMKKKRQEIEEYLQDKQKTYQQSLKMLKDNADQCKQKLLKLENLKQSQMKP